MGTGFSFHVWNEKPVPCSTVPCATPSASVRLLVPSRLLRGGIFGGTPTDELPVSKARAPEVPLVVLVVHLGL